MNVARATAASLDREAGLLAQAQAGDRDAFAQLVEPRLSRLLGTARAVLANEADALDVTQEAFVAAWVNLPRLRDRTRFDAWIHRVLMNRCRDVLRTRRRSREMDLSTVEPMAAHADDPTSRIAILAAFDRLSLRDRQILVLHHLHDLPIADVAQLLGVPEGTAKSRLHAARRALERALEAQT